MSRRSARRRDRPAVNESGIAAESAATKAGGGQYADITELFCTADTLVYVDSNHLNTPGRWHR
jgi:hypothetical protein